MVPDRFEFHLDHTVRQVEFVAVGEDIEQIAFQAGPRQTVVVPLDVGLDRVLERLQVFGADRLGERIVDFRQLADAHFLDGNVEGRVLAGQMFGPIVLGEGNLHRLAIARFGADQLVLETWNEGVAAEVQIEIFGLTALERLPVHRAAKIDDGNVARCRFVRFRRRLALPPVLGEGHEGLIDRFLRHRNLEALEFDRLEVHDREVRQDLERHGVFQIAAFLEIVDLDLRLHRRLEILVLQRLGDAILESFLQDLAQYGLAEPHLQNRERRLAPAEPRNLQVPADFGQLVGDLAVDIRRGDGYFVFAFQAFGRRFRHLHG